VVRGGEGSGLSASLRKKRMVLWGKSRGERLKRDLQKTYRGLNNGGGHFHERSMFCYKGQLTEHEGDGVGRGPPYWLGWGSLLKGKGDKRTRRSRKSRVGMARISQNLGPTREVPKGTTPHGQEKGFCFCMTLTRGGGGHFLKGTRKAR